MKISVRIISTAAILVLGISLVICGCQPAKKPMSPATPDLKPQMTGSANPNYPQQRANRITAEAAKVSGVRIAYTVISGRNIYVGLDLSGRTNRAQVERMVANKVKNMEPGYSVNVSTDNSTVASLKNISRGIAAGKPLSSYQNQLSNFGVGYKAIWK